MVERPRWADWLVLVLAFQAHWLFDHSDDVLSGTRRPVWWVVIAVLVVGTVLMVTRRGGPQRWWAVACLAGPVVWTLQTLWGDVANNMPDPAFEVPQPQPTAPFDDPTRLVPLVQLNRAAGWAWLPGDVNLLIMMSAAALLLRSPEAVRWLARRLGPPMRPIAVTAGLVALLVFITFPDHHLTWLSALVVLVVAPIVLATRSWMRARWILPIGFGTGGMLVAVTWFLQVGPDDRRDTVTHAWVPVLVTFTVVAALVAALTLGVRRLAWRIRYE